jgi:transcription elongation factor
MKISELPQEIKELALENIEYQKREIIKDRLSESFIWNNSKEGYSFWDEWDDKEYEPELTKKNKYQVNCKGISIDVYDVLNAFNLQNPAIQHAIKKLLKGGERGVKSKVQDYKEAIESITRAIELENN